MQPSSFARTFVMASLLAGGPASSQPSTLGLSESPCPRPDVAAERRRDAITELVLRPAASPEAFQQALERILAEAPPVQADQIETQVARDWPNLCRYKSANEALEQAPLVVFMGDSITEGWVSGDPDLFANGVVGRGIGGQTSPQMLVRFRQDVVALGPQVVHIMAGTNDIAGNTGPTTAQDFQNNILSMVELARANDIAVILAAIPPSNRFYWRNDLDPLPSIRALNEWLRATAQEQGLVFVDYGTVLADANGGLRGDLGNDGVHPNRSGYGAMRPLAERAIATAIEGRK